MDIVRMRTLLLLWLCVAGMFLLSKAVNDSCVDAELGRRVPIMSSLLASVKDHCQNTTGTTTTTTTTVRTTTGCVPWNRWGPWFKIPNVVPCTETRFRSSETCQELDSQRRPCVTNTPDTTTATTTATSTTATESTTVYEPDLVDPCSIGVHCAQMSFNDTVDCPACIHDLRYNCIDFCSSFLVCTIGVLAKQPCPTNLWYNPASKVCEFPRDVSSKYCNQDPENPGAGGSWRDWSFWTPCSVTCGDGIQFRLRQCSHPGGCQGPSTQTRPCNLATCFQATTPPPTTQTTKGTTVYEPDLVDPCSIDVHCAQMTLNDTVNCQACIHDLRYNCIDICTSYLSCNLGVLAKQPCPPNLWYNPASDMCEFPRDVPTKYCNLDPENPGVEVCDRDKLCAELAVGSSDNCFLCDVGTHYSCPDNCRYYLTCMPSGMLQKQGCQAGLAFNPEKQYCDFPANVPEIHCHQN